MMTTKTNPSCGELGACQRQTPRCQGCSQSRRDTHQLPLGGFVFAPGVIEGPSRRRWLTPRRIEKLVLALLGVAFLVTLATTLAIAAGHLALGGTL